MTAKLTGWDSVDTSTEDTITKDELKAAFDMLMAVAEGIRELGQVPEGHLYARLMDKIDLDGFNAMMRQLTGAKLIKIEHHLITWIGPK